MDTSLVSKYRPKCLDEVLGQPEVVRALKLFVAAPYTTAMIMCGDTGVGKSASAVALAHEIGCSVKDEEAGGRGRRGPAAGDRHVGASDPDGAGVHARELSAGAATVAALDPRSEARRRPGAPVAARRPMGSMVSAESHEIGGTTMLVYVL